MKKSTKTLIMIFAVLGFIGLVIWMFTGGLLISFSPEFKQKKNVFDIYQVKVEKVGTQYHVKFKDVVASSADTTGKRNYYRFDMTVTTDKKETADAFSQSKDEAVAVIRNRVSTFRTDDVRDVRGKRFMKESIKNDLRRVYGLQSVGEVYFENFVHN